MTGSPVQDEIPEIQRLDKVLSMNKILTVVIPTYNMERYLENCLNSFARAEAAADVEVLIIDDGSKDSSAEIAAEFVKRWPETFRLIKKENGGHGSAINRGIREAQGTYFKVVDSDDWVDGGPFSSVVAFLKKTDSDIVASNYSWYHENTGKRELEYDRPFDGVRYGEEYDFSEISHRFLIKMHAMTIRTDILKEKILPIDEHCYYVDMEYVLFPIPFVHTITFLDEVVYLYRIDIPGQSMNIESMQKNAKNFDRVLQRLLSYYSELKRNGAAPHVLSYMENALGTMTASRFKIFLSFPARNAVKQRMIQFDEKLKKEYPEVYAAVNNRAVLALRKSGYRLYLPAHTAFCIQERLKR